MDSKSSLRTVFDPDFLLGLDFVFDDGDIDDLSVVLVVVFVLAAAFW